MKPIFSKLLVLFSLLLSIGCRPTYYKASMMNIPNFTEKNEVHLATNLGTSDWFYAFHGDIQAAYAVTNHLAIQGNYMRGSDIIRYNYGFNNNETERFFALGECAVGYFTPFDKYGTFSIFGGYGKGRTENDMKFDGKTSADFSKLFVQSSVGYRDKNIEFVGSVKLATLNYTNLNQTLRNQYDIDGFNVLNNTIPIIETGWITRIGGEKVKFQMQATTALQLVTRPLFDYNRLTFSAGVCFQLNTKKTAK